MGAMVNSPGAWLWRAWASMRAMGLRLLDSAAAALISSSALAPSEMELELAAVIEPSAREHRAQGGNFVQRGLVRLFIVGHYAVTLACLHRDWRDFRAQ